MTEQPPTVFVIDDDASVRRSLTELLSSVPLPVETFESGPAFLEAVTPERGGCLLLDMRLKEGSGLDLQDELRRRAFDLPVIVLTGHGDVPSSVRALKAGAFDFLQKPAASTDLLTRVCAALEFDVATRADNSARADATRQLASLTPREHQVMSLLLAGETSKEVAYDLAISVRTVEGHRGHVLQKLHVTSAAQLVRVVMNARGDLGGE